MNPTRRDFLSSSALAAGWLALSGSALATLAACAREDAATGAPLLTLTPEEGRAMRAFTAQIVPSGDGLPGAEEAGAVHFIDRAVTEFMPPMRPVVTAATTALDERAGGSFADLDATRQNAILEELQNEGWFGALRFLTLSSVFAGSQYDGGLEDVGFRIVQVDHRPSYQPPFGFYDASPAAEGGAS